MEILHGFKQLEENIYIGEGVEIASGVKLAGPLLIAKGARIEAAYNWATSSHRRRSANIKRSFGENSVIMAKTTIEKDERIDCAIGLGSARVVVKPKLL